jgi:dTDP-4-amino-4,6-dideoxygalactose transaminase
MPYKVPFYKQSRIKRLSEIDSDNFNKAIKDATKKLENKFVNVCHKKYALSVNNPSSAIHMSMCAIDLKRGDKVICAINTYVDTPEAIRHFDSEPVFVDIEPRSYHINIESLKEAILTNKSKKLRAIVVNHFAGLKVNLAPIIELAKKNNLYVIEDFSNTPVLENSINIDSDIAIFSLNFRLENTLKGAMLTFKDEKTYQRAKLLREHGVVRPNEDVNYIYDVLDIGCDYRLDELSAYLLDGFLEDRKELVERKKEIANIYFQELKNTKHITLPIEDKNHLYSYFIIEIDKNRDHFARELKKRGVEVGLQYIPLNFTTYYKQKYKLKVTSFPNALSAFQKVMSLPCNGKMSKEDALYVCQQIKEVAKNHI